MRGIRVLTAVCLLAGLSGCKFLDHLGVFRDRETVPTGPRQTPAVAARAGVRPGPSRERAVPAGVVVRWTARVAPAVGSALAAVLPG